MIGELQFILWNVYAKFYLVPLMILFLFFQMKISDRYRNNVFNIRKIEWWYTLTKNIYQHETAVQFISLL